MNLVDISTLKLDPKNARKHSKVNLDAIKGSLKAFGQQKPIVVNKDNVVIAGNGTLAAAKELRWQQIGVVVTDLDAKNQKAFALADNRSAELAEWDDEQLGQSLHELFEDGFDIGAIGFEMPEVNDPDKDAIEDDVPEVPQNIHNVQRGQIWQLGGHRLMCGDSTSKEDVERLMNGEKADLWIADPPFGVSYMEKNAAVHGGRVKNQEGKEIKSDTKSVEELCPFWKAAAENAYAVTTMEASNYWCACQGSDMMMMMMMMMMNDAGWNIRHELIWVKSSFVFGRSDYHYRHEPIIYGWKIKGKHNWYGDRKSDSVLEIDRPSKSDLHPTTKPVELFETFILNSSKNKDLVFESFGGSGTSIIASEKTGRRCNAMELDEHYCSVIIERWQNYTDKKAELLTELHVYPNGETTHL